MTNMEIANTILDQIGGAGRVKAFIGVKQYVAIENGLQVNFKAKAANSANIFQVILDPSDTYTLKFFRARGIDCKPIGRDISGIYCDQLKGIIEEKLGLRLTF